MIGTKSPQDWMNDWQALQQQYWNAWSDATRGVVQPPQANTPWQEGLEQWSKMFGTSSKQTETADRLISSAKNYVGLMQSLLGAAAGKMPAGFAVPNWTDALRNGFNMSNTIGPGADAMFRDNPFTKIFADMRGPHAMGFDKMPNSFAPFLNQMKQEGLSWLHAPAFGFARERQEHYQKMTAAFVDFQDALGRYNALMLKSSQRSFEIFESKLGEHDEPGRQIDSMRALYDLWVDAAEDAYAEIALSEEFRKVYGDVVNSQMRVRQAIQQEVERMSTDFGMPTRSELNGVHKRLQDLRREVRNGRSLESSREIDELRAEVRELKRAMAGRPAEREKPSASKPEPVKNPSPPRVTSASRPVNPVERIAATSSQKKRPSRKVAAKRATAERSHTRSASVHGHAPLSFADAIKAMQRTVAKRTAKRKSAAAVAHVAVKSSQVLKRKHRRQSRSR